MDDIIIGLNGVGTHPTDTRSRSVISLSGPNLYTVVGNRCTCKNLKAQNPCAHSIAAAHSRGELVQFVTEKMRDFMGEIRNLFATREAGDAADDDIVKLKKINTIEDYAEEKSRLEEDANYYARRVCFEDSFCNLYYITHYNVYSDIVILIRIKTVSLHVHETESLLNTLF